MMGVFVYDLDLSPFAASNPAPAARDDDDDDEIRELDADFKRLPLAPLLLLLLAAFDEC